LVVDVGVLGCCETGVFAGDQAELDELAVFDDVVGPVGGDSQPVGGQGVQAVAAGDEVGQGAGDRDVQRVGYRLPAAQVDHGAEVAVLVGLAGSVAEGGGDVAGGGLALALRVLGGHGGELPGTGQVRRRGRVAGGEDVRVAGDGEEFVDHDASFDGVQPERLGERPGCDADGPHQGAGGHAGAVRQPDLAAGGLFDGGVQPHVDAAAAQDAQGRAGEPRAQLGQDRRGAVDQ
jgi:hypothetical protein